MSYLWTKVFIYRIYIATSDSTFLKHFTIMYLQNSAMKTTARMASIITWAQDVCQQLKKEPVVRSRQQPVRVCSVVVFYLKKKKRS